VLQWLIFLTKICSSNMHLVCRMFLLYYCDLLNTPGPRRCLSSSEVSISVCVSAVKPPHNIISWPTLQLYVLLFSATVLLVFLTEILLLN